MLVSRLLLAFVSTGFQLVAASPAVFPSRSLNARADNTACAIVRKASASFLAANPTAKYAEVPAKMAFDCLKSVPMKKDPALNLTRALRSYIQLQSTIDYLRDPPSGFLWDPVDIPSMLDAIEAKILADDTYRSEYDLQVDLQSALIKARDGHLTFQGDLLSTFVWKRPKNFSVTSISVDGKKLPEIYFVHDILKAGANGTEVIDNPWISAIQRINGLDAEKFFLADANSHFAQDPDAAWNTRFARVGNAAGGGFEWPIFYPGPVTEIEFRNGTKISLENKAIPLHRLDNISTGEDMYTKFCATEATGTSLIHNERILRERRSRLKARNRLRPVIADASGVLSGYYLEDRDVAVLAVSSFLPGRANHQDLASFQNAVTSFLDDAASEGKTKLLIDLQGNGGGSVDLELDLLAQLFPDVAPNSKQNMRASQGMHSIILAASNLAEKGDVLGGKDDANLDFITQPFAFQEIMTPDVQRFNRLEDFYGPNQLGNGSFTNFFQTNYTNDEPSQFGFGSVTITGFGNRTGYTQPFEAHNIIMLTDGFCASACAMFQERMKQQGVQIIAMGGRPQTGPMQAVGGTKGSLYLGVMNFWLMLDWFHNETLNTELDKSKGTDFEFFGTLPISRSAGKFGVNGRNQFRIGDITETPLQFVYEAADCRIWQTPEMIISPLAIWDRVATLAFENRKDGVINSEFCVTDSTKHSSSLGGGLQKGQIGNQTPPTSARSKVTDFLIGGKDLVSGLASGQISV